jgi:hypothetical protein
MQSYREMPTVKTPSERSKAKASPRRHGVTGKNKGQVLGNRYLVFDFRVITSFARFVNATINHKYQLPNTKYLPLPSLRGKAFGLAAVYTGTSTISL